MLLAIDVGNTHITVGLFRDKALKHTWRLNTNRHYTSDELGVQLCQLLLLSFPRKRESIMTHGSPLPSAGMTFLDLSGICIASVVPSIDEPLRAACDAYFHKKPLFVGPKTNLGIINLYKNPEEVGADRLVNAVAVHTLYRRAAIVVDFGTATTLDCVSAKGEYLGGAICPGMELAGEWLATHTAKLPRVTFQSVPTKAIGKTTKESLQSGLFWGYISLVGGLLQHLTLEMRAQPIVVATGGLSTVIGPYLKPVPKILPNLTLEGLRLIWERN